MKKIDNIDKAFLTCFCLVIVFAISAYFFAGNITVNISHFLFSFRSYDRASIAEYLLSLVSRIIKV